MHELRTELSRNEFDAIFERGYATGYRVVGLFDDGECRAAAGYHLTEGFFHGPFIYVDDLITSDAHRSSGYGKALTGYLEGVAREAGCTSIQLDSGSWRHDAHRFYFREGFVITSFHFGRPV